MTIKKIILGLLAITMSGCAFPEERRGRAPIAVGCLEMQNCYIDARKACGGDYKIIDAASEDLPSPIGQPIPSKEIIVRCEKHNHP